MPGLTVPAPDGAELVPVAVFASKLLAAPADLAADAWLSKVAGEPVRLVHLDDPTRRHTDPGYSRDSDRVSFADGYPLCDPGRRPGPGAGARRPRHRPAPLTGRHRPAHNRNDTPGMLIGT
jgi:hypothetical protein